MTSAAELADERLTPDQVAEEFDIPVHTVRRLTRLGKLPANRDAGGRRLWIRRGDVVDMLDQGRDAGRPSTGLLDDGGSIALPSQRTRLLDR